MILLKGQGILTRMTKMIVLQREILFGRFDGSYAIYSSDPADNP